MNENQKDTGNTGDQRTFDQRFEAAKYEIEEVRARLNVDPVIDRASFDKQFEEAGRRIEEGRQRVEVAHRAHRASAEVGDPIVRQNPTFSIRKPSRMRQLAGPVATAFTLFASVGIFLHEMSAPTNNLTIKATVKSADVDFNTNVIPGNGIVMVTTNKTYPVETDQGTLLAPNLTMLMELHRGAQYKFDVAQKQGWFSQWQPKVIQSAQPIPPQ